MEAQLNKILRFISVIYTQINPKDLKCECYNKGSPKGNMHWQQNKIDGGHGVEVCPSTDIIETLLGINRNLASVKLPEYNVPSKNKNLNWT